MFGLEEITYRQFAGALITLVCIYYFLVFLYLFVKARFKNKPEIFELEEETGHPQTKTIHSADLLSDKIITKPTTGQALEVSMSLDFDLSGYSLDELDHPDSKHREAFIKELQSKAGKSTSSAFN